MPIHEQFWTEDGYVNITCPDKLSSKSVEFLEEWVNLIFKVTKHRIENAKP